MAAKGEGSNEFRQSEVSEPDPTSAQYDSVDALVSSFLAELTDISSEMKTVRQPGVDRITPAENASQSEEKRTRIPPSFKLDEVVHSESKLNLAGINNDVDKHLIELESLKSRVVPIASRKEFRAEPQSPIATSLKQSTAVSTPQPDNKPAKSPARSFEEQNWDSWEIFRARVASPAGFRRRRNIFLILTAAALTLILGYFYFFRLNRTTPALNPNGQIPDSEARRSDTMAAGSWALPDKPGNLILKTERIVKQMYDNACSLLGVKSVVELKDYGLGDVEKHAWDPAQSRVFNP